MNTYRSLVLGFGFASLASLAGCTTSSESPYGADPDFAAIESRFRSPTGTFDQSKAGSTLASYNDQKKSADSKGSVTGGAGGTKGVSPKAAGLALRSLKKLTLANGSSFSESSESSSHSTVVETDDNTCADLKAGKFSGNCACKNGGNYDYDFESARALQSYKGGPIDVIMRAKFNDCAQDEVAVDGPLFVSVHAGGADSDGSLTDQRLIMDAKLHGKQGTEEHDLAFTVLIEENKLWMSITVDDGNVVMSTSSDWSGESGTFTIRDREHTYNCSLKDGDGACTLEDGGKMAVSAKASAEASTRASASKQ